MMPARKKKKKSRAPYVVGALVAYILISTQFFAFLGSDVAGIGATYLGQARQQVLELVSGIDLNRMTTFLAEGFSFGGLAGGSNQVAAEAPTGFRFVRRQNLVHDPATLSPPAPASHMVFGDNPIVYIYNTHTWERFSDDASTVTDMSLAMGEIFEQNGIPTLVEERSVEAFINERFGPFMAHRAYEGSRIFMEERISQFDSLMFFFDIHRDSEVSDPWTTIDGEDFARVKLVIGTDNPNFRENEAFATGLMERLDAAKPGILRNRPLFYVTGGPGRDGNFNQDLSPHALLFEFGDVNTPAHAAFNTARLVAQVLSEYILSLDLSQ